MTDASPFAWPHPSLSEDLRAFLVYHGQHFASGRPQPPTFSDANFFRLPLVEEAHQRLKSGGTERLSRAGWLAWKPQDKRLGVPYLYGQPLNPHTNRRITYQKPVLTVRGVDAAAAALSEVYETTHGEGSGATFVEVIRQHAAPEAWALPGKTDWLSKTECAWQGRHAKKQQKGAVEEEARLIRRIGDGLGMQEEHDAARVMRLVACGKRDERAWQQVDRVLATRMSEAMTLEGRANAQVSWGRGRLSAHGFSLLLPLPHTRAVLGGFRRLSDTLAERGPNGFALRWDEVPSGMAPMDDEENGVLLASWAVAARAAVMAAHAGMLQRLWGCGRWTNDERFNAIGRVVLDDGGSASPLERAVMGDAPALARVLLLKGAAVNEPHAALLLRAVQRVIGTGRRGESLVTLLDEAGASWSQEENGLSAESLLRGIVQPGPWVQGWIARLDAKALEATLPRAREGRNAGHRF